MNFLNPESARALTEISQPTYDSNGEAPPAPAKLYEPPFEASAPPTTPSSIQTKMSVNDLSTASDAEIVDSLMALRLTEMAMREKITKAVREAHEQKLWRKVGHSSLMAFCRDELGYDSASARELCIAVGAIFPSVALVSSNPEIQARITALRHWRSSRAWESRISAFRIVTNRTLMELAEKNPATLPALLEIRGLGERKVAAYGPDILEILKRTSKQA